MVRVAVDGFKEVGAYLTFNALFSWVDDEEDEEVEAATIYSAGWRLHNKILMPPSTRGKGNKYWEVGHLSPALARKLYKALLSKSAQIPAIQLGTEEHFLETSAVWAPKDAKRFFPNTEIED